MPGITDLQTKQSTQSLVDFLNADPSQVAFGLENQIDQLFQDYIIAKNSGDTPTAQMLEEQINSLQAEVIRLKNMRGDTSYARDMMNNLKSNLNESGRTISNADRMGMAGGGEAFPDLTGDGKVTKADILKGRGVFAEGDEVILSIDEKINNELKARGYPMDVIADLTAREKLNDVMRKNQNLLSPEEIAVYASSNRKDFSRSYIPKPVMGLTRKYAEGDEVQMGMMEMEMEPEGDDIQESLMAIQGVSQEAAPLDQFVQAVIQMIQAGASEQEVIEMLRQAGLDEEDINAVFQAVMQSFQGPGIDQELAALG